VTWYLDTSAFLKLVTFEDESTALRAWYGTAGSVWSSQLLRTEGGRAGLRLGIEPEVIHRALDTVSLVLPSVTTFAAAAQLQPVGLRSLDALHLATALEIGDDLEGLVSYDTRMVEAAQLLSIGMANP
jgi:uncharacterized protein